MSNGSTTTPARLKVENLHYELSEEDLTVHNADDVAYDRICLVRLDPFRVYD